jgi:hypothetical protein
MRDLVSLLGVLVLGLIAGDSTLRAAVLLEPAAPQSTSGDATSCPGIPPPGWVCVDGTFFPLPGFQPEPPSTPTPRAISVGEEVTGTLHATTCSFVTGTCIPGVFEMLFELTAPSDGTLVVEVVGEAGLEVENGVVHYWPITVGILPVTAGRTYRIGVSTNPWDLFGEIPFVLTTSITSGPPDLPPFCSMGPPASGWICYGEGWAPPGHQLVEGTAQNPAPPPPPPPQTGCTTPDPFAGIPGLIGVCIGNNNWIPSDRPLGGGTAPAPPPLPPPPPPPPGCTTPDPFAGIPGMIGVCIGNNTWVPLGHPLAGGGG